MRSRRGSGGSPEPPEGALDGQMVTKVEPGSAQMTTGRLQNEFWRVRRLQNFHFRAYHPKVDHHNHNFALQQQTTSRQQLQL